MQISSVPTNSGIVPPWLTSPSRNSGVVPPWLTHPDAKAPDFPTPPSAPQSED